MMNRSGFHWSTLVVFSFALSGCATFAPAKDAKDAKDATILSEPATKGPKTAQNMPQSEGEMLPAWDLDRAVGQAQTQRKMGDLQGATRALSQLVLVAPDDPRVLGEYGKTLVAMGRSDDALAFLERAIEIQPLDWSLFSAQGVAYDQEGNYMSAQTSYEHALALKPGEPAVLSNNALSPHAGRRPRWGRTAATASPASRWRISAHFQQSGAGAAPEALQSAGKPGGGHGGRSGPRHSPRSRARTFAGPGRYCRLACARSTQDNGPGRSIRGHRLVENRSHGAYAGGSERPSSRRNRAEADSGREEIRSGNGFARKGRGRQKTASQRYYATTPGVVRQRTDQRTERQEVRQKSDATLF